MPSAEEMISELEGMREKLEQAAAEAEAKKDEAKLKEIDAALLDVDKKRAKLAIGLLAEVASGLSELRAKIEAATRQATSWPFGASDAPEDHDRPFRAELADNDFSDPGPDQPAPAPGSVPSDAIPVVSPGWANNYTQLWQSMTILPQWKDTAAAIARKIIANQSRYAAAVAGTNVPWWFIAVVHCMECSLRFDQHLHNGDPLRARTVNVPPGRPPSGSPPFDWEVSARDSIQYERLDKVPEWSLTSALFNWHRYNGINNEYKKREIPTPYLWSGSQHYRKGKYVADRKFDPEAVSKQAGAAVILKALIDLGAVSLDAQMSLTANPAAATGEVAGLVIDTSAKPFKHIANELDYPGLLKNGAGTNAREKRAVRRIQEWLNIHDCATSIDGAFVDSTEEQLRKFQISKQRQPTGELDEETWALLTAPMRRALAPIDHGAASSLEDAVLGVAQQHIREKPIEVGGNNCGPWVRLYMEGEEGEPQKWCAGFVCMAIAQAARDLGIPLPFKRQVGVDELVKDAQTAKRFIAQNEVPDVIKQRSKLRPGYLFVVRASASDWTHVGIVMGLKDQTFDTLEGNTGGDGGTDGANARESNRSFDSKDFLRLI
jgi:lysozyme family protein